MLLTATARFASRNSLPRCNLHAGPRKTRTVDMALMQVELDDKYRLESKRIFLSMGISR
jgi:indolepyruvate ferredoxin oxidoreductase